MKCEGNLIFVTMLSITAVFCCFLEQDTLPLLLSTGWFQERTWSWFQNRTQIHCRHYGRFT